MHQESRRNEERDSPTAWHVHASGHERTLPLGQSLRRPEKGSERHGTKVKSKKVE